MILEWIKGITRPVLTVFLLVSWFYMIINGVTVPLAWEGAAIGALGWWYYDRSKLDKTK